MIFKPLTVSLACLTFSVGTPVAAPNSEIYIVSRTPHHDFLGSHQIFKRPGEGLHPVHYCGHKYWVRPYTIVWTQREAENGSSVRVERHQGRGFQPICDNPAGQVTLSDLDIEKNSKEVTQDADQQFRMENRFGAIKESFQH